MNMLVTSLGKHIKFFLQNRDYERGLDLEQEASNLDRNIQVRKIPVLKSQIWDNKLQMVLVQIRKVLEELLGRVKGD